MQKINDDPLYTHVLLLITVLHSKGSPIIYVRGGAEILLGRLQKFHAPPLPEVENLTPPRVDTKVSDVLGEQVLKHP